MEQSTLTFAHQKATEWSDDDGFTHGEGPRWRGDRLWFSNGPTGRVYSPDETGDLTVEAQVPRASGLGWLPDGTLVVPP